jgi:hypothetical protein
MSPSLDVSHLISLFFFDLHKKNAVYCNKTRKKLFLGVEGCAVDHPRITIIKRRRKKNLMSLFSHVFSLQVHFT